MEDRIIVSKTLVNTAREEACHRDEISPSFKKVEVVFVGQFQKVN